VPFCAALSKAFKALLTNSFASAPFASIVFLLFLTKSLRLLLIFSLRAYLTTALRNSFLADGLFGIVLS